MSRHRVLAIAPKQEELRRMVNSLRAAGAEVDAIRSCSAIHSDFIGHRYVFIDIGQTDRSDLRFVLDRTSKRTHIAVIVDNPSLQDFTELLSDHRINHIISREEFESGVLITAKKLLTGDIFGIEHYLPPSTPVNYLRLNDFAGRGNAIDTILKFAEEANVRSRLREGIGKVCEELLMNALYDAPVDESGEQVFAEIDPHDRVDKCSPRPVSIRFAATDTQFAIAVRDRYGRLAKNTIIAYINKCLNSPTQIDRKTYGAGLGLYLVANAAASYTVNVAYSIATEVICTFDRRQKLPLRLVGVFIHPGEADRLERGPTPEASRGHPERP